ncbi:beta-N-acetylglucosaminyltransferase [Auricularia subglabra TFB-10046 SS5]|nr:beta-N-acetylglucosaminyltransferase [Auricularia subglabra TFB-10046 SS5]
MAALDPTRYTPRTYIISSGDTLSAQRAAAFEGLTKATVLEIPRARAVHQPLHTVPRTFLISLLHTLKVLRTVPCDVLLLNGPGTCVVLCVAVWLARFLGVRHTPRVVYVESFARVRSLSLSARIVAPLVDRLVVQWPQLADRSRFAEYRGWLI